jgi:hypothetical protein
MPAAVAPRALYDGTAGGGAAAALAGCADGASGGRRRIAVISLGTRGDAQPLLAVAQALLAAGCAVHFLCMAPFLRLAEAAGVPATSIGEGMDELLGSCAEARALRAARTPWAKKWALDDFIRRLSAAHWAAAAAAFDAFCPDTALLHGMAFFSLASLCELRHVKMAIAHCVPVRRRCSAKQRVLVSDPTPCPARAFIFPPSWYPPASLRRPFTFTAPLRQQPAAA